MSNKLKAAIDPLAGGAGQWYMAGGGAAWWHIINHMTVWHGAHDWAYFETVQEQIFPHDIEGSALREVRTTFAGKYGMIDVGLSQLSADAFGHEIRTFCSEVEGVMVYTPQSLINRYKVAGNPDKKAKRDLRTAMLTLVIKQQPITPEGVEANKPKGPALAMQLGGGMAKLKKASDRL